MNLAVGAYHIKPQTFPWPPVYFAMAMIAAFILRQIAPLGLKGGVVPDVLGIALLAGSLLLAVAAVLTLKQASTAVLSHRRALHLVTRGPFRITRNPVYLGYIMALAGCGLLAADAWFFIAAILITIVMTFASVRCEEMHLLARFGMEFERYCQRTPRWL